MKKVIFAVIWLVWGLCAGVANSATTMVTYQVSTSADDGFAQSAAMQDITSAFLKIGDDRTYAVPYQMSAMRFNNINIPRSATIISANLKITSINTDYRGQIYGVIAAEASDNPADFSSRMIGNAALAVASVVWDYKTAWSPDTQYISPDISNVVQEVVNRPGFGSGNSIAVYYSTRALSGKARSFASYEYSPSSAAVLEVTYETYTISGHILTTEATPLENVTVSAGADIEGDITDASGYYELKVPPGWSGSITAKKIKWEITPLSYSYSQLTADIDGQDYIADYLGVIIVKADGTGDYPTIQTAIDAAVDGDIVQLEAGTFSGDGNRDIDFKGKAITLRGATGDPNDCIIDCQGDPNNPHRGFKFVNGEDNNSILEGLTITNGYGPDEDPYPSGSYYSYGGGIYCESSSPMIKNAILKNNFASSGGGISNHESSTPKIVDCVIVNNTAYGYGGGIHNSRDGTGSSIINNCTIEDNSAFWGAGISNSMSSPKITNCIIVSNLASAYGGGIRNVISYPDIKNCKIANNSAGHRGGGIYNSSSSYGTRIRNCVIRNNSTDLGGAIYNSWNSLSIIDNCTIIDNSATDGGGISNYNYSGSSINNSIVWGNTAAQLYGTGYSISYSNIQGGYLGTGNINQDPCFVDPCDGNYRLKSQVGRWDPNTENWVIDVNTSPCIDAGDPNSDWTAELWPHGKCINIGAYGGTPQASMSNSTIGNIANLDNDVNDVVDYNDLDILVKKWCYEEFLLAEDLNHDGVVNSVDYGIFANNWLAGTMP